MSILLWISLAVASLGAAGILYGLLSGSNNADDRQGAAILVIFGSVLFAAGGGTAIILTLIKVWMS